MARVFDNGDSYDNVRRTHRQSLGLRRVRRGLLQIASGSPAGRALFLNVGQTRHHHRTTFLEGPLSNCVLRQRYVGTFDRRRCDVHLLDDHDFG